MLFNVYIRELIEEIGGGMQVGNVNVRVLMFADDIVLTADKPDKSIINVVTPNV